MVQGHHGRNRRRASWCRRSPWSRGTTVIKAAPIRGIGDKGGIGPGHTRRRSGRTSGTLGTQEGDGGKGNNHSDQGLYYLFAEDAIVILSWGMCWVGGNRMVHMCGYVDPLNLVIKCLGGGVEWANRQTTTFPPETKSTHTHTHRQTHYHKFPLDRVSQLVGHDYCLYPVHLHAGIYHQTAGKNTSMSCQNNLSIAHTCQYLSNIAVNHIEWTSLTKQNKAWPKKHDHGEYSV